MRLSMMRLRAATALLCGSAATAALAHHPMEGAAPLTAWQGVLSGLAHPVIGPDHLLFIVAASVAVAGSSAATGASLRLLLAFVAASTAGTLLRLPGIELPHAEAAIGASLLVAAWLPWARWRGTGAALALACAAGLLHGHAYGEAIVGAESTPLLAYLAGLTVVQAAIAIACFHAVRRWRLTAPETLGHARRALSVAAGATGAWVLSIGLIG